MENNLPNPPPGSIVKELSMEELVRDNKLENNIGHVDNLKDTKHVSIPSEEKLADIF